MCFVIAFGIGRGFGDFSFNLKVFMFFLFFRNVCFFLLRFEWEGFND